MPDNKEMGQRIQAARKRKGITQQQLADSLGLATGTVQQYELGKRTPKNGTIKAIAAILEMTPFDLIGPEWFDLQAGPEYLADLREGVNALHVVEEAFGEPASQMVARFSELNDTGQQKALDYISDLAEQPKYQK